MSFVPSFRVVAFLQLLLQKVFRDSANICEFVFLKLCCLRLLKLHGFILSFICPPGLNESKFGRESVEWPNFVSNKDSFLLFKICRVERPILLGVLETSLAFVFFSQLKPEQQTTSHVVKKALKQEAPDNGAKIKIPLYMWTNVKSRVVFLVWHDVSQQNRSANTKLTVCLWKVEIKGEKRFDSEEV